MKRLTTLIALLLCTVLPAQTVRSLGASDFEFWVDYSKLYVEFRGKRDAEAELAKLQVVYDDPNWRHRPAFQALSREMLRKRIIEPEIWKETNALAQHWSSGNLEFVEDRWWSETQELVRKSTRQELSDYLHTAYGASEGFQSKSGRFVVHDIAQLRWEIDFGDCILDPNSSSTRYRIEGAVLKGFFKQDSTQIDSLYGWFDPRAHTIKVDVGRVDWYRAGYGYGEVYNQLAQFDINLRQTGFIVDSAVLHSLYYVTQPLKGRFEERLGTRTDPEKAIFPRFEAYVQDLRVKDFFAGVDYSGGFSLIGQKFFASGTEKAPAVFSFWGPESKIVTTLRGDRFVVKLDGLQSKEASFKLTIGEKDSIYHSKIEVGYDPSLGELRIYRPDQGLSLKPFTDSYHHVTMDFDQLRWTQSTNKILFGGVNMGSAAPMIIESDQYYRNERYAELQGFENKNPLITLSKLPKDLGGGKQDLKTIAQSMGMPFEPCERLMMDYHLKGFVRYDVKSRSVEILPKAEEYVLNHKKKRDFDVIQFESIVPDGMNAELDLLTNDIRLVGVDRIWLSDSQKVSLHPTTGEILLHQGLDFDFDGLIRAGRFEFFGRQHQFHYDEFSFQMPYVDSMRFYVPAFEVNEQGERPLVRVRNTLQDISGDLYVDYPNNKSSTQLSPEYPIFKSGKGARIYYDRIQKGVYPKATFYADLDAFTIDSLDNARTEGLGFESTMLTAGIYDPFRQTIKVQEDYSLGFTEETSEDGWSTYPGALGHSGNSQGTIKLSLDGFRLEGNLRYQNARSTSSRFDLYPDSTAGRGAFSLNGVIGVPRGGGFPSVEGSDARNSYRPYQKKWISTSATSSYFSLYSERPAKAQGSLTYEPQKLTLNGLLSVNHSELRSVRIDLHARWVQSTSANFRVKASDEVDWGFSMNNAQSEIDFATELGQFTLNEGGDHVDFPRNKYRAELDQASWNIQEKSILLNKLGTDDARLTSLHPGQGGLSFQAKRARFLLVPSQLDAYKVPHIDVADSRVFPDSGHVVVYEDANMKQLANARVVASKIGQYHEIDSASIKIQGRQDLYGNGIYRYKDLNDKVWRIPLGRIDVDTTGQVYGLGEIPMESDFYLSPYFQYYGTVKMFAQDPQLLVEGRVRINAHCPALETDWIITKNRIDPYDILFVLPDPDTATPAQRVYSGIYLMQDSTTPYTAFVRRNNPNVAVELFSSKGVLYFDQERKSYIVSTADRVANSEVGDNWFEFNTQNCSVTGYGKMTLGAKMGQVQMASYGRITHNLKSGQLTAKSSVLLDFMFPEELLKPIKAKLETSGGIGTGISNDAFDEVLMQVLEPRDRKRFLESGLRDRFPKELRQTLVLSEVDFTWKPELRAFRSSGYLDVGAVSGDPIHRGIQGTLELRKRRGGDEFTMYLRPNDEVFFTYKKGSLRFYSSDRSLLEILARLDPKKRTIAPKKGEAFFTIVPTTGGAMSRFLEGLEDEPEDNKKKNDED